MHCLHYRKHLQDANKVAQGSACDIWWWIWRTRMFSFRYMVLAAFCPTAKRPRGSALFMCVPSVWHLPTDAYANISIQCAHASCLELNQRLGKRWWAYKVGICRSLYKACITVQVSYAKRLWHYIRLHYDSFLAIGPTNSWWVTF